MIQGLGESAHLQFDLVNFIEVFINFNLKIFKVFWV